VIATITTRKQAGDGRLIWWRPRELLPGHVYLIPALLAAPGLTAMIAPRRRVLSAGKADELRQALSETTTSLFGTARLLELPPRYRERVSGETGTHEIHPPGRAPPRVFGCQYAWLTGFILIGDRPIALRHRRRDPRPGRRNTRVRQITSSLLQALTEARR
jgi:hypothetical protein